MQVPPTSFLDTQFRPHGFSVCYYRKAIFLDKLMTITFPSLHYDMTPCPDITCSNLKLHFPRFSSRLAILDLAPSERAVVRKATSRANRNFSVPRGIALTLKST